MRTSFLILPLLALAAPVAAQSDAPPAHDRAAMHAARHAEMQQAEADDMAIILDLKPAQRPALDAFLKESGPPERPMGPPPGDGAPARAGFEEHLQRMEAESTRHAAEDRGRIAAARAFYATLDPHQRQVFEALIRLRHGPGGHGGPGHGPMDRPGGPEGPGGPMPGQQP